MRIIAGKLRHRPIKMTNLETTRETQDKVRGAIFNMIGPYFDGGIALDLFAGSGAMGIEAYSRGISQVYFNDIEPKAIQIVKENCSSLKVEEAFYTCLNYEAFLDQTSLSFDLIFLDPPYKMSDIDKILEKVETHLSPTGIVVFEASNQSLYPESTRLLMLVKNKCYGIKRVLVYKSIKSEKIGTK